MKHARKILEVLVFGLVIIATYSFTTLYMEENARADVDEWGERCQRSKLSTMWKITHTTAALSPDHYESFVDIYPYIMKGEYGDLDTGIVINWIRERNPNCDTTMFKKIRSKYETKKYYYKEAEDYYFTLRAEWKQFVSNYPPAFVVGKKVLTPVVKIESFNLMRDYITEEEN